MTLKTTKVQLTVYPDQGPSRHFIRLEACDGCGSFIHEKITHEVWCPATLIDQLLEAMKRTAP